MNHYCVELFLVCTSLRIRPYQQLLQKAQHVMRELLRAGAESCLYVSRLIDTLSLHFMSSHGCR